MYLKDIPSNVIRTRHVSMGVTNVRHISMDAATFSDEPADEEGRTTTADTTDKTDITKDGR